MIQLISLLVVSCLIPAIAFRFYPGLIRALVGDLRLLRILHYFMLVCLGFALYMKQSDMQLIDLSLQNYLTDLVLFAIALIYAAVFAIVTNNIEDLETDKVTNQSRPLVQNTVNSRQYLLSGIFCLCWSFFISLCISTSILIGIFFISLSYYVYSCKPFKLKRIPILAKLFIGFNSLVAAVCGFVLAGGNAFHFPESWMLYIMVPLSLAANFIDLKDTAGDQKAGVQTLPVLMGEKRARLFISLCTVASYVMPVYLLQISVLYPVSGIICILHLYLLNKKPYREKPVFIVYISAIGCLIVILLFYKQLLAN